MATTGESATITSLPSENQAISHNNKTYTTIREGRAYILVPPNASTVVDPKLKDQRKSDDVSQVQSVFYNPIQQFNRDLSVIAIKAFGEDACQRKRLRHESNHAKELRKRDNKRKRTAKKNGEAEKGVEQAMAGDEQKENPLKRSVHRVEDVTPSEGGTKKLRSSEDVSNDPGSVAATSTIAPTTNGRSDKAEGHPMPKERSEVNAGPTNEGETRAETSQTDAIERSIGEAATNGTDPIPQHQPSTNSNSHDDDTETWRPRFRILDALSATGLRALRYASEIPFATAITANDRDKNATEAMNLNIQHNKLSSKIRATTSDALGHMYGVAYPPPESHGPNHISGKYDVIDLDPYGTAAPFIDAALLALEDGGMLCVTCTDSGVFASCGYSEKTFSLYGGMPIKGPHSHEGGLRLILQAVAASAARHGISIEPLLSLSIDFYVRLFIRIRRSPADVKFLAGKTMLVYGCDHGCGSWKTQFLGRHNKQKGSDIYKYTIAQAPTADRCCEFCGSKQHVAGPMWGGPLHNPAFVERMLSEVKAADESVYQTRARMEGMLDTALDELIVNSETMDLSKAGPEEIIPRVPAEVIDHHPFFFIPSALCKVVRAQAPSEALIKGALRHAGYRATRSHCKPGSIKTDAPWPAIWEIIREWVRQKAPIKEGSVQEMHPGWKILQEMRVVSESAPAQPAANGTSPDIVTEEPREVETALPPRPMTPVDMKQLEVVFDEKLGKDKPGKRLVRYQENPRENWGPMRRAQGSKA